MGALLQASPFPPLSLLTVNSVWQVLRGGSWLGFQDLSAMGVVFILELAVNIVCVLFCFHRVDDLDKELKVLTATHSALQLEASKKGATLKETTFYLTTLKQDNDKLQEVQVLTVCLHIRLSPACMSLWLSVCLSVCMYGCLSVCMYGCLSVCMYGCLSVCMYGCLSVCMYGCLCLHVWLSVCLHVWLSVCLYGCLSVCVCDCLYGFLSVCMYGCLSVHLLITLLILSPVVIGPVLKLSD